MSLPCPPCGMPSPCGMPPCMPYGMPPPCGPSGPYPPCNPCMPPSCFMPPPPCYYPYPPPPCYMPPSPGYPCRPQPPPPVCFPTLPPQCQIPPQCGPPCPPKQDLCPPCGNGRELVVGARACPPIMRNGGSCIPKPPGETSFFRKPATYNNCNFYVTPSKKGVVGCLPLPVTDNNQKQNLINGGGEGIDISLNVDTGTGATCAQQTTFQPGSNAPAGDGRNCPAPVGYPGSPRWGGEHRTSGDRANRRATYESSPRETKHSRSPRKTSCNPSPQRPLYQQQQRSPPINVRRPVQVNTVKRTSPKPYPRAIRAATKSRSNISRGRGVRAGSSKKSRPPWRITGSNCAASGHCSTHRKNRSTSSKSKSPFRSSRSKQRMISKTGGNTRTNIPHTNYAASRIHANIQMQNGPGRTRSRIHIHAETSHSNVNAANPRNCSTSPHHHSPARQCRKPLKNTCFPKCPPARHKKKSCSPKHKVCYTGPPQPPACPVPAPPRCAPPRCAPPRCTPPRCAPQAEAATQDACGCGPPQQPTNLPFSHPVNHACPPPRMIAKHKKLKQVCNLPKQTRLKNHFANNCHAGLPMPKAPTRRRPAHPCRPQLPPVPHFQHQSEQQIAGQSPSQIRFHVKVSQTRAGRPGHGPGPLIRCMSGDYNSSRQEVEDVSSTGVDELYKNEQQPVSSRTVNVRPSSSALGRSGVSTVCISISAPTLSSRASSHPRPPGVKRKDKVRRCRSVSHNNRKHKQTLKTIDEAQPLPRTQDNSGLNTVRSEEPSVSVAVDDNKIPTENVPENEDTESESYAETDTEDQAQNHETSDETDGEDPGLSPKPLNDKIPEIVNSFNDKEPEDSATTTSTSENLQRIDPNPKEEPSSKKRSPSSGSNKKRSPSSGSNKNAMPPSGSNKKRSSSSGSNKTRNPSSDSSKNPSSTSPNDRWDDDTPKPESRNRKPAQQENKKPQAPRKYGQDPNRYPREDRPKRTEPEVDPNRKGSNISRVGSEEFLWTAADSGFRNPPAVLNLDEDDDRVLVIKDGYSRYESTKGAKLKAGKNVIPPPAGFAQLASTKKPENKPKVGNRK